VCRFVLVGGEVSQRAVTAVAIVEVIDVVGDGDGQLEYDDPRSGDFSPLRFVPPGKMVVLGLVTT
jgi:hypothetical protein